MRIEETGEESGCFPRLGFREAVEATPFVVCPKKGGPLLEALVRLEGNRRAMFQLSNVDREDFVAEVEFSSKYKAGRSC
jgi:hypothetical protein